MGKKENIVAVIPARGGSKGIPRKNLKLLEGKPLIAHIIETALKVPEIDRVLVSTDDWEIAKVAKKYGAEVPFMRLEELSGDTVLTAPVLQHSVDWLKENENYNTDIIVLVYATSPLLKSEKISEALKKIEGKPEVDSVVSLVLDDKYHWKKVDGKLVRIYPNKIMRRQDMDPYLRENGALYIMRKKILEETGNYIGGNIDYVMMKEKDSWDIDTEHDLRIIEALMKTDND
ncbi:MAG: acylneuraminate cytidylyltransferase family protein [Nanoarchaeota archaeon]